jgi:serine/threonine-protein kinase RsbW
MASVADDSNHTGPNHARIVVPASTDHLNGVGADVGRIVAEFGGNPDLVADMQLAVSELATNVIHHTKAASITIDVAHAPGVDWTIDVHDVADSTMLQSLRTPRGDDIGQRGLIVVRALMDTVSVMELAEGLVFRCTRAG